MEGFDDLGTKQPVAIPSRSHKCYEPRMKRLALLPLGLLVIGGFFVACSDSTAIATDAGLDVVANDVTMDLKSRIASERAKSSWHMYAVEWARSPRVPATKLIDFGGPDKGLPDGGDPGFVDMSWNFYVLVGYNRVVLVDAGTSVFDSMRKVLSQCAGGGAGVDAGAIGCDAVNFYYGAWLFEEARTVTAALGETGLSPSDVTDVVVTHFHFDHSMSMFEVGPNAKIHMMEGEWDSTLAYYKGPEATFIGGAPIGSKMEEARANGRTNLITTASASPYEGITILEKGKHTAHSIVVKVDCGGKPTTILMDAAYTYRNVDEKLPTSLNTDKGLNVAEVQALVTEARQAGGIYLPGHDRAMMDRYRTENPLVARICGE